MIDDQTQITDRETGEPRYSLSELTDEAGVSVRTVRYYIAEGLLPPPVTAGPRSHYTREHLDRLRLIDRLKAAYLPLKEIRRRLTGLSDDEVRRLTEQDHAPAPVSAPLADHGHGSHHAAPARAASPSARPPDSATAYIARLLHRPDVLESRRRAPPAMPPDQPGQAPAAFAMAEQPSPVLEASPDADLLFDVMPPLSESDEATASWRRVPIADGAEILIRDDLYDLKRDRVDWLIGWARKVFG